MIKAQKSWVKHRDTPKYQEGDLVWLEGCHLQTNQPTPKLAPKRHGPFPIIQVMSSVNYRLKLPTQWSIHDVFHIDLLTPYQETDIHGSNYSRPAPDLVNNEEEYKVEKILDTRQFGRRCKRQYLIKWRGYPDSDNEWVDHKDIHAPEVIREFKSSRTTLNEHISRGTTGKYPIIPLLTPTSTTYSSPMSNDTNAYYLGSLKWIFGAELDSQLITYNEARELCAKKYIQPQITDENELAAPLTEEELARVREVFPNLQMAGMPPRPLSPLLQEMSDPSGMGATPTHQADTQVLDNELWEAEGVLRIPPRVGEATATITKEGQCTMEGGAVRSGRVQEKHCESSQGSTVPQSTPAT